MSDDTARRERAEKSLLSEGWTRSDEDYEWARGYSSYASDRGFLHGYLAGSREEAAIKDAEIVNLKSDLRASGDECGDLRAYSTTQANEIAVLNRVIDDWHKTADDRAAEIIRQDAEIAFLREQFEPIQLKVLALENRIREDQADFLESFGAKDQEIAALREYVRWRETGGERRMEPLSTEAINAFGRAMEETP